MKHLNIWLIQTGETLPIAQGQRKMRTALLAAKLAERGHQLLWWAGAFEHQRKIWVSESDRDFQVDSDYKIRVLHGTGYKKNISISRYFDHLMVARKFRAQSKQYNLPDILVISMPCYHLAYAAMLYAIKRQIPYLVDIRDLWPDIFTERLQRFRLHKIGKILLRRDFNKVSKLLKNANSLVGISKGCLNWGLSKISRDQDERDKVFYHGYQSNTARIIRRSVPGIKEGDESKIFLFVGTFGESYELEMVLEVAGRLAKEGRADILFYLAGVGEKYDRIKSKATSLPNVTLPGWIDAQKIHTLLNSAWAGIVPCKSVENAAPNKVFEYLSAGLPLVSSLQGEIADLIDTHQIGLNYEAGDAYSLYQCVKQLSDAPGVRNNMVAAAQQVFKQIGDADKIYNDYADHIENLYETS